MVPHDNATIELVPPLAPLYPSRREPGKRGVSCQTAGARALSEIECETAAAFPHRVWEGRILCPGHERCVAAGCVMWNSGEVNFLVWISASHMNLSSANVLNDYESRTRLANQCMHVGKSFARSGTQHATCLCSRRAQAGTRNHSITEELYIVGEMESM